MVAGMVVMRDEGSDLAFEVAWQVVVLEQDAVLERLMPALDLALGLRMERRTADMLDVLVVQPIGKIARDIRRAVVRQEPWPVKARQVVQHGGEIAPAPARDLEIGEVGLPELVGRRGLVLEFLGRSG